MRRLFAFVIVAIALWMVVRRNAAPPAVQGPSGITPVSRDPIPVPTSAPSREPGGTASASGGTGGGLAPRERIGQPDVGFRTSRNLDEHFAKHGAEFGNVSKAEYLRMAQQLRDAEPGGDILEIVRPADGVVSRFDKRSGAFEANDRDGTIRTFFKPNDGEAYFRRQAKRRPQP